MVLAVSSVQADMKEVFKRIPNKFDAVMKVDLQKVMNMKMFNELEGNLIKSIGILLFNTLTRRRTSGSTELATATE